MSWLIYRRRKISFSKTTVDLILIFLVVLFFYGSPVLNPSRMSLSGESMDYFVPSLEHFRQAVYHGYLPLWNSDSWLGAPFLANFESMSLYPPQVISLLFSPGALGAVRAQNFLIFLSLLWLAYGAYFFGLWALDLERYASILMAVVMGCSGFVGGHLEQVNQIAAISWIPWIMAQALIILRNSRWSNMALMAFFIGMQILSGHPQYVIYSFVYLGVLVACYSVYFYHRRRAEDPPEWHGIVMIMCAVIFGSGLAAVQLLPAAELSQFSVRNFDSAERVLQGSFPPTHIFASFMRDLYGSPATGLHAPFDSQVAYAFPYNEFVNYVGIVPVILALVSVVVLIRESIVRAFSILALFSVVMASGKYLVNGTLYRFVMIWFPGGDDYANPARFMIFFTLSVSVLAGVGLNCITHYLVERRRFRQVSLWPLCLLVILAAFSDLYLFSLEQTFRYYGHIGVVEQRGPILDYLIADPMQRDARIARLMDDQPYGQDLHDYNLFKTVNKMHFSASIRAHTVQPDTQILWNLQSTGGYEQGYLPLMNYRVFIGEDKKRGLEGAFAPNLSLIEVDGATTGTFSVDTALLGLMNVRHIISKVPLEHPNLKRVMRQTMTDMNPDAVSFAKRVGFPVDFLEFYLYENLDFIPKLVWGEELESVISLKALNVSPLEPVVMHPVDNMPPPDYRYRQMREFGGVGEKPLTKIMPEGAKALFNRPLGSPNSYYLEKEIHDSGRILLLESPYPGWRVTWQDGGTDMIRANACMMSADLPAGSSNVHLAFQPFSYRLGLYISCCFAAILVSILVYCEFPFHQLKWRRVRR